MPFGDHLGTYEDVGIVIPETLQNVFEGSLGAGAIAIKASDAGGGQVLVKFVFHAFRASSEELNLITTALRAGVGNFFRKAAHVAKHAAVAAVQREDHRAVFAQHAFAALAADHEAGEAATVEQQNGLLAIFEACFHFFEQGAREGALAFCLEEFGTHVDDSHLRHGALCDALGQFKHGVAALISVVTRFNAGSGGTEHDYGVGIAGADDGHVAAVIARCFLLFVAAIVFFIDDNEAEILNRGEDTGASAHDDASLAVTDATPLVGTFGISKGGVKNGYLFAEAMEELAGNGGSERDFRDQQQGVSASG